MKYIRDFQNYKTNKGQQINEEFLFGLLGKLFGKIKERINRTKGGKEIEAIYQKWLKVINTNVAKLGITELNIINQQPDKPVAKPATKDEARAKALNDLLNKQKAKIEQVIEEAKKGATQEMEGVLGKMGGAAKNPQLDKIIKSKLLQFKIDVLNAEIAALTEVGDTASASNIQKLADTESKKVEETMKDFDTAVAVEFKVGDKVIYKRDKFNLNNHESCLKGSKLILSGYCLYSSSTNLVICYSNKINMFIKNKMILIIDDIKMDSILI
jgi:fructose-1,6-bisphosphatase